jgi:gas vesicle protein
MRTEMECRSLGENKSTYTTNSSVRQMKQKDFSSKNKSSGGGKLAVGLLAGAAAGAIAGVLLAPEKGKVTRQKVAESASKLGEQVNKGYSATRSKVESWTNSKKETYINPNLSGNKKQSPYTDTSKWDDQEVNRMVNDARRTPGL